MSSGEPATQAEVASLRATIVDLSTEIRFLTASVAELEQRHTEFVEEISARLQSLSIAGPVQAPSTAASAAGVSVEPALEPHRVRACEQIGAWLRHCLNNQLRGKSGREQIEAPSQFYLVARDKDNCFYNPPKVLRSWREAKPWVYHNGAPPRCAIFVGLPSLREVRLCCIAAELEVPAAPQ